MSAHIDGSVMLFVYCIGIEMVCKSDINRDEKFMTIYVDESIFPFRGTLFCHMATDGDLSELHQMALSIGMQLAWFQDKKDHPHYDLSPEKRALAIAKGAVPVTSTELISKCFKSFGGRGTDGR